MSCSSVLINPSSQLSVETATVFISITSVIELKVHFELDQNKKVAAATKKVILATLLMFCLS